MKKYTYVCQWIEDNVLPKLNYRSTIPTEHELSQQLSVSITTVRKAIKLLNDKGLVTTIQGKGTVYVPYAQDSEIRNIGVICFFLDLYIFPSILKGIELGLNKTKFRALLQKSEYSVEKEKAAIEFLLSQDIVALIVEPIVNHRGESNILLYKEISKDIPVIFLDNKLPTLNVHSLINDDFYAGMLVAQEAYKYGHRDFGFVVQEEYFPKKSRVDGAIDWLKHKQIFYQKEHMIKVNGQGVYSNVGEKLREYFSNMKKYPSVFICSNDQEAIEFIRISAEFNIKIPEDISVIGFDNSDLGSSIYPRLTSTTHPKEEMGKIAALVVEQFYDDRYGVKRPYSTVFNTSIVLRDSLVRKR